MSERMALDVTTARRLAVACQHLAGPRDAPGPDGMRAVLRSLRCLQLDPITVVAPSHQLVLFSRLGPYDRADLDTLLWKERWLFEYWAHAASIVLTEDFPLHRAMMDRYPVAVSSYGRRLEAWMEANSALRTHILQRLREAGPTPSDGFEDLAVLPWTSSGWTAGRNVERMLDLLWLQGRVTVAGRRGRARVWDLTERSLPHAVATDRLPDQEVVRLAVEHALRALGVARAADIARHFTRDRYPGLDIALKELEVSGAVLQVDLQGADESGERWYLHADRLPLLETVTDGAWQPRTTLLSPFDNLVCDRERTERLWGFRFRNEMYVPRAKRQYGYYVLPLLHGERLIGRVALRVDRRRGVLRLEGMYAEPDAPATDSTVSAVCGALRDLAAFTGADTITLEGPVPERWSDRLAALVVSPA